MGQNTGLGSGGYGRQALTWSDQESGMAGRSRDNALDRVVVVVSGNRSLDNVLGRLYGLRPATPAPRPGPGVGQL
jgi:hypothetical protein